MQNSRTVRTPFVAFATPAIGGCHRNTGTAGHHHLLLNVALITDKNKRQLADKAEAEKKKTFGNR